METLRALPKVSAGPSLSSSKDKVERGAADVPDTAQGPPDEAVVKWKWLNEAGKSVRGLESLRFMYQGYRQLLV